MKRSKLGLSLVAVAFVVGACAGGTGSTTRPSSGSSPAPSTTSSTAPSAGSSTAPSTAATMAPESMAPESMAPESMGPESMGPESPAASDGGNGSSDINSAAATLRTDLNYLLGEHQILTFKATGAALGGRQEQFDAYGALLNTNGTDLGSAIGGIYGQDAEDEWNRIWSAHNGFFVDYTTGVATDDMAMQDQAVSDLTTIYVPEFAAFLAGATGLPEDALVDLITEHVLTTKAVVDAQASGDAVAAAGADRMAAMHMRKLGDPLAEAIVNALPDKF